MTVPPSLTPQQAWDALAAGNERFVGGTVQHPHQDPARRDSLADGQHPHTVFFGCSDSRPTAEIIFDQGLGDMFVVRNAGQVVGAAAVGSIEFGVGILQAPLLLVLGHESCGAVRAAIDSTRVDAPALPPAIWRLIATIVPTVQRVMRADHTSPDTVDAARVGREHVRDTVAELLGSSAMIANAVADGRLGIVGAVYNLGEGTVVPHVTAGPITIAGL
ncbi:carbonic anhydrase [Microbacterium kribbense]|uniref:Carbonic anhydrase n=1 Tax=Microbacterium kribbense TaxID=433645 RepID=A0ABP7GHN4_9MICO